jgi:hypothetical protein
MISYKLAQCLVTQYLVTWCLVTWCLVTWYLVTWCLVTWCLVTWCVVTLCVVTRCLVTSCLVTSCLAIHGRTDKIAHTSLPAFIPVCAIFSAPVLYRTPQALNLQGAGEGVGGPLEGPPGDIPGDLQAFGDSGPWAIPGGYRGDPVGYTSEGIPCGVSWGIPCESHIPQRTPGGIPWGTRPPIAPGVPRDHTRPLYERRDKIAHMSTQFAFSCIFSAHPATSAKHH